MGAETDRKSINIEDKKPGQAKARQNWQEKRERVCERV